MENRDRDKMSKNVEDMNRSKSSNLDKSKSDSQSNFGKNIGRSEDISNEPSRRSGQGSSDLGSEGIGSSKSSERH